METFIKAVITVFFIGLVVGGIVLFSIFLIVPADKLARVEKGNTSSNKNAPDISKFNEQSVIDKIKLLFGSQLSGETQQPQSQQQIAPPSGEIIDSPSVSNGYNPHVQISGLIQKSDVPADAINLMDSSGGFIPKTFSVKAGSAVVIAFSSSDSGSHLIAFENPELANVSVGVGPGQLRALSFIAPKAGEYAFRCAVPGHATRGEVGIMTVR